MQVGDKADSVRLVVSTLAEAEQLRPYLQECKDKGKSIDVSTHLYYYVFESDLLISQVDLWSPCSTIMLQTLSSAR